MLGRDQRLLNLLDRATDGGFTYLIGQTDMKRCPVFAPVHQREQPLICPAQFGRAAKRAQSFFHNGQHLLEGVALNSSCPFEVLMTKVLYHFISHLSIIMLIYDLCKRSIKGDVTIRIPNPHEGDIGKQLLLRILRQAEIAKEEWENL